MKGILQKYVKDLYEIEQYILLEELMNKYLFNRTMETLHYIV